MVHFQQVFSFNHDLYNIREEPIQNPYCVFVISIDLIKTEIWNQIMFSAHQPLRLKN